MSEAERIADGLSEAQRKAVLEGDCVYMGNTACVCNSPELAALQEIGLAGRAHSMDEKAWALTVLGSEVRQILLDRGRE